MQSQIKVYVVVLLLLILKCDAVDQQKMISIPAGSFTMGYESKWSVDSKPEHKVYLDAFIIDQYEVTQGLYETLIGENPSEAKRFLGKEPPEVDRESVGDNYPVTRVSWFNAVRYCNARSLSEGLEPCYDVNTWECNFNKNGYRLPTEAEWEYACRAGTTTKYFYGDDVNELIQYANYWAEGTNYTEVMAETGFWDNPFPKMNAVGQRKPNNWGLYDMLGNVAEWCNDWYDEKYYSKSPKNNPQGPEYGEMKVVRGRSYRDLFALCGDRSANYPSGKQSLNGTIGFRCVRSVPKK